MNYPAPGFYYHYKHQPDGAMNNYAYEVIGIGLHTESDRADPDHTLVVYRPLYKSFVYQQGQLFDIRPLRNFMEKVKIGRRSVPRFAPSKDTVIIESLLNVRHQMYSTQ